MLLLHKAAGLFGGGKWNAPGGKVEKGENPLSAASREVEEETGIVATNLSPAGELHFYLGDERVPDMHVHLFRSFEFRGSPRPSREGIPEWFSVDSLPYAHMWEDDAIWVPHLLSGRRVRGSFYFEQNYGRLLSYELLLGPAGSN